MANWTRFFSSLWNIIAFFREAWFLGSPTWTPEGIEDLAGKVVIVTGGSSGIGVGTIRALLKRNTKVYLAGRNEEKSLAVINALFQETGRRAEYLKLDLADLKSVEAAATEFKRKEMRLDVLFNNAGSMTSSIDDVVNGYDMVFHTNVLGPFYFTALLLPLLKRTGGTKSSPTRVVNLTSSAHHFSENSILDFNSFKDGAGRRKYTDLDFFYVQSKAAVILFSNELARRYGPKKGVISLAVNPGNFKTALTPATDDYARTLFQNFLLFRYPTEWSVITQLWAGFSDEAEHLNGKYIVPWGRVGNPHPGTQNPELAKELWAWLQEQSDQLTDE